ncbi:MAG: hypothetical protein LC794_11480 [Acidobacteria bacterium]|nr:hypothetical protein [Acidobacteriota bacterium]MCA1627288.1 hypothetical protein [Acidobacteriota bacterium]
MTLTNIRADQRGNNVPLIDEIRNAVGALSDGTPFLLWPIRIETRFIQREVPRAPGPTAADTLIEHLNVAVGALDAIAKKDFATDLKGTVKAKKDFKRRVEVPLYDFLQQQLTTASNGTGQANKLLRDAAGGTEADAKTLNEIVKRGTAAIAGASQAIARLRSTHQREQFQKELARLQKLTAVIFNHIRARLIPTLAMVHNLRTREPLFRRAGRPRGEVLPLARLADSAVIFDRVRSGLEETILTLDAAVKAARRLDRTAQFAKQIIDATATATANLRAIALIPGDWKLQVNELATARRELVDRLATALERGAIGGGEATTRLATQGRELRASQAALEKAINEIRSDDKSLDREVAPGLRDAPFRLPVDTQTVNELWVRIFPDDIAIETHETRFTSIELESGQTFWRETIDAGGNDALLRGAWRVLCLKHGSNRAAWIALQTQPSDVNARDAKAGAEILDALTALDRRLDEVSASEPGRRLGALLRAGETALDKINATKSAPTLMLTRIGRKLETIRSKAAGMDAKARGLVEPEEQPLNRLEPVLAKLDRWLVEATKINAEREAPHIDFADVALKDGNWTSAPHSGVLPHRFVVVTANADRASHVVACEPVNPELKLGIDPDPANQATEQYALDANGNLVVGESIRWMVDFDEAIKNGMGVKIRITADEAREGFDRVYVLGVQTNNADAGRQNLERLIDNHHFGQNGLALVPIGTPTNNAESETAGYKSSDDPDESYAIERGAALFDPNATAAQAADGLRLARALGMDPAALAHVAHAGGHDVNEAFLVNRVLWPGTFGNYLEEFFGSLLPIETRDWIAEYSLAHVTARGLIPGLRVGPQPYGVLPTTAFSSYVPSTGPAVFPNAPATRAERRALFNRLLRDVLLRMQEDWTALRMARVKHAHSTGVTDFQQHFLDILGLESTSATSAYRLSLNCARRHPPVLPDDLLDFGVPRTATGATSTAAAYGPVALLDRFSNVFRDALQLGPGDLLVDGQVSDVFDKAYRRLLHSRAYEVRHLQEPKPLLGESIGTNVATWVPQLLAATPSALVAEARANIEARPLLYLLIRQALLTQFREATLRILATEHMLTDEARRLASSSDEFLVSTLSKDFAVTQWNYVFAALSELDGRFGITFPAGAGDFYTYLRTGVEKPMAAYLENRGDNAVFRGFPGRNRHTPFVQALTAHASDTQRLAQIPVNRLDQLLFEHLDVVSYRLDAWLTGLAAQRLAEMRDAAPRGVYIGAYGWIEDLRPDAAHPLASNVPAALISDAKPIHVDLENQGFIHAPSLNHAVTAAILRSGYLSEAAQPDVENRMAVNLSSRRVRLALALIEGVRAGNDLGSLLGYQFERFLHEAYATEGVTLDDLIAPLRRAFPSTIPVDENLSPDATRQIVVDGLALHQTVQAWVQENAVNIAPGDTLFTILHDQGRYSLYPFGLQDNNGQALLPPTTNETGRRRLDGLLRALDSLADAVDAIGDLVISEGVYQIAQGNHVRAAAAVSGLAQGKAPPRPEIVDTPRTGTLVSQRLFLQIPPVDALAGTLPQGWRGLPETPRAVAEPSLNNWLGTLIGPPENLRMRIVDRDGVLIRQVSAADLGMQPVDLLSLSGPGLEERMGELASRVLDVERPGDVDDDNPPATLRLELQRDAAWDLDVKSFVEIAPLLESVWELLTRGRPATSHDWVLEETTTDGGALLPGSMDDELSTRVSASLDALKAIGVVLLKLLSDDVDDDPALLSGDPRAYLLSKADVYLTTVDGRREFKDIDAIWARRNAFIDTLKQVAAFGITQVDPPVTFPSRQEVLHELFDKLEAAFIEVATRVQRANKQMAELPATGPRTSALTAAAKTIFGEAFVILPHFNLRNADTIANSFAAKLGPANDPTLDGWLLGVAAVRANAARLARVVTLADAFGTVALRGVPAQLPHVDGDPWFGTELPPAFEAASDRLSLVAFGADALDTNGGASVGILVDQWTEIIPSSEETTGVAVHYDQPDSMPPQCLLLAVPPERRGKWRWEDLVVTLHETLELAKNRAVELEHLHDDLYGQILPGITGELVPVDLPGVGEIPDSRVILDFGQNNPAPAPGPG